MIEMEEIICELCGLKIELRRYVTHNQHIVCYDCIFTMEQISEL